MSRKDRPAPRQPDHDEVDVLEVRIRLRSGRFESSIEVPLKGTKAQREEFIESWFKLMESGIRIGTELPEN
jgi:hypothetical protein